MPLAVYRLDGGLFVTSSFDHPESRGFPVEADPEVLIDLAQGATRLEVPVGNGDFIAYWYQLNKAGRPVALVALRYASRSLEAQSRMDLLRILSGVFGLVFAAAGALAFLLARSISRPLSRLGAMMERMDVSADVGFEPLRYAAGKGTRLRCSSSVTIRWRTMCAAQLRPWPSPSGRVLGERWRCRWRMKSKTH